MGKLLRKVTGRAVGRYRAMGIQMVISLSFTAVAIVGMVFMGMSLFLRFSTTTYELMEDNSQRVLAQVNMNLDGYLRRMMRVSDTLYYRIIKNTDLEESSLESGMSLLYEENRESIVSIAVFDEKGRLVSAAPLSELKPDAELRDSGWFQVAIKKMENFHFSTPHVQNLFQEQDACYRWVVSLSSQVQLTRGGATETGVLLVDMSFWSEVPVIVCSLIVSAFAAGTEIYNVLPLREMLTPDAAKVKWDRTPAVSRTLPS